MKKRKNNKTKLKPIYRKIALILLLLISSILVIVCIYTLIKWEIDNKKSNDITNNIDNKTSITIVEDSSNTEIIDNKNLPKENDYWDFIKKPLISVDFIDLIKKNNDTVGWIKMSNSNINYPIVQSNDNDYYLTHAFDKSLNGAGWIFSDYRNNFVEFDLNTVIYGHGRQRQTMFGTLKNILLPSWQKNKDNQIIYISTPKENTLWQVFSVYTILAETYYITTSFNGEDEYNNFLNTISKRSLYPYNVPLNSKDKIITLSTCKENDRTSRLVLHAKLIKREKRK
ncbi:MAG: class B sortase [Bacilli bacterium]